MSLTREISDYVVGTTAAELPENVVSAAKRVTLDAIGVVVAATRYAPGRVMNDYVAQQGGSARATVLGTGVRTTPQLAALANGTMAADMELDDVHPESSMHCSSVMVPALLAVAEDRDVSGSEWVTSLVAAYDVGCRVVCALRAERLYARGFHPTAIGGIFGATAGVARLSRLSPDAVMAALGLAGSQAAGLLTWQLEQEHFAKSIQSGIPARSAVMAAELAELGYRGAADIFDGRYNVFEAFGGHREFGGLVTGLGEQFELLRSGFKVHTSCRTTHTPIDIVLELARQESFSASDVDRIVIYLAPSKVQIVDNNVLTTHNVQFIVAVALIDGMVTRAQTTAERRADPEVDALASRITVVPDPALERLLPEHRPARLRVSLKDGRVCELHRDDVRGDPDFPLSDGDIENKFRRLVSGILAPRAIERVVGLVDRLDEVASMRELVAFLRV